jgi:hypothetical protein
MRKKNTSTALTVQPARLHGHVGALMYRLSISYDGRCVVVIGARS